MGAVAELELVSIEAALLDFLQRHPHGRLRVGYSGGRDSTVLLAALAALPQARERDLRALHVDHGLHPQSSAWAQQALTVAARLALPCQVERVEIASRSEIGIEARARAARREACARHLQAGDWLLLAHHRRDQAETVLMRLLAGAGPRGLSGMAEVSALPPGHIGRPLLGIDETELQAWIDASGLPWIEDPANADERHERSWLRQSILPQLRARKPGLDRRLARLADWQRELAADLAHQATAELQRRCKDDGSLSLQDWPSLSGPLRHELLCAWLARHGQPRAGLVLFECFESELVAARDDAEPRLRCHAGWLRRFRRRLYWVPVEGPRATAKGPRAQGPVPSVQLPADGRLGTPLVVAEHELRSELEPGIVDALPAGTEFRLDLRRGGERFRPAPGRASRELKSLLQELGIPPWQRQRLWLLWIAEDLAAVLDPDSGRVWLQSQYLQGWQLRVVEQGS